MGMYNRTLRQYEAYALVAILWPGWSQNVPVDRPKAESQPVAGQIDTWSVIAIAIAAVVLTVSFACAFAFKMLRNHEERVAQAAKHARTRLFHETLQELATREHKGVSPDLNPSHDGA